MKCYRDERIRGFRYLNKIPRKEIYTELLCFLIGKSLKGTAQTLLMKLQDYQQETQGKIGIGSQISLPTVEDEKRFV